MSIFNTLQTAVSGLAAQSNRIGTIGDNIANASTTGYKDASTEFQTLLGDDTPSDYQSGGVQTKVRYAVTAQGDITSSSSVTDLAISGNGFFAVKTSDNATALTRAGAFVPNADGELVNTDGDTLLGYNLQNGSYNATTDSGTLVPVNISSQSLVSNASTSGTLAANLPSQATAVAAANLPSTNSAGATYTEKSSLVAYDNLGAAVNLDVYTTKTGANTWAEPRSTTHADARRAAGGFPYSATGRYDDAEPDVRRHDRQTRERQRHRALGGDSERQDGGDRPLQRRRSWRPTISVRHVDRSTAMRRAKVSSITDRYGRHHLRQYYSRTASSNGDLQDPARPTCKAPTT